MADETLRGIGLDMSRLCSGMYVLSVCSGILVNLGDKDDNKRKKATMLRMQQRTLKKRSKRLSQAHCNRFVDAPYRVVPSTMADSRDSHAFE